MLIKFEADDQLVDRLKVQYGQKVAAKAFHAAAADAVDLFRKNQDLHDVIDAQRTEIRRLQRVIEQARSAAVQLFECTAQGDLIDG
ncbi:hypothetical protein DN824_22070 [Stutzerimonas nosocomialis]|uniref:hypothetical protein n=1 Tax=Stutzerimonas nosocomialis TaxID=1056496 RepID=UPI0011099E29|nr:hypothetical protein [Stutzerimonas nosocomialis]TLX52746.1 hypothetical protein DN824_22070 [Stutzerimonas nosocomialis]